MERNNVALPSGKPIITIGLGPRFFPGMSSNLESYRHFNPDDEGKRVVTDAGDVVGDVDRVKGGKAFVKPEPGLLDGHGSLIGGLWAGVDPLPLDGRSVESVTDETVVLKPVKSESRGTPDNR